MRQSLTHTKRVLAIDPCSKGFGFAVLEGPQLIGWGMKTVTGNKNVESLKKVAELVEYYRPHVLVLENPVGKGSRRCLRVRELLGEIVKLASSKRVQSRSVSRTDVRQAFAPDGAVTKHQIAVELAKSVSAN